MIDPSSPEFWPDLWALMWQATGETLYMVGVALLVTLLVGLPIGVILVGTERGGVLAEPFGSRALGATINRVLDFVVNVGRSVPFVILMIALIPVTRFIVGTFVGTTAAIVPLSAVAIPFFARMVEIALKELDPGLIEAADAMGADKWQLVRKVMLPEAMPAILLGLSTTVTSIINFSAMVGVVGGRGLGNVALTYGYQRYSGIHILVVVIIIFIIVQTLQAIATWGARRLSHRTTTERRGFVSLLRRSDPPAPGRDATSTTPAHREESV